MAKYSYMLRPYLDQDWSARAHITLIMGRPFALELCNMLGRFRVMISGKVFTWGGSEPPCVSDAAADEDDVLSS
jgi:hypothetical protein